MSPASSKPGEPSALEYELAGEMAAALGRSGRRLQASLRRLREHEARLRPDRPDERRAELLIEAADAYWSYIVQREAMGLTGSDSVADEYEVPLEVRRRAGPKPRGKRRDA